MLNLISAQYTYKYEYCMQGYSASHFLTGNNTLHHEHHSLHYAQSNYGAYRAQQVHVADQILMQIIIDFEQQKKRGKKYPVIK